MKVRFNENILVTFIPNDDEYEQSKYESKNDILINLIYKEVIRHNYAIAIKILNEHAFIPDIDRRFDNDMTMLHLAFIQKEQVLYTQTTVLIKALLSHGSSLTALDKFGYYPLHYTNLYLLKMLLATEINFQDIPLAVIADSLRIFEALSTSWGYHNLDNLQTTINIATEKGFEIKILPIGPLSFFESAAYFLSNTNNYSFEKNQLFNIVMRHIERDREILNLSNEDISNYRIDPEPITDLIISYLSQIYKLRIIIMLDLDNFEIFQSCNQVENEMRLYRFERDFLPILSLESQQIGTIEAPHTANYSEISPPDLQPVTAAMAGLAFNHENCG